MRAAARGIVDFREARLLDPDWWTRFLLLIREMVREDDIRINQNFLNFHLALVGNSGLDDNSFKEAQKNAQHGIFDVLGLLRPWEGQTYQERKKQEYQSLREAYVQEFGDPASPEFQAREAEALARWQAQLDTQAQETDIERVMRLRMKQDVNLQQLRRERQAARRGRWL